MKNFKHSKPTKPGKYIVYGDGYPFLLDWAGSPEVWEAEGVEYWDHLPAEQKECVHCGRKYIKTHATIKSFCCTACQDGY